MTKLAPIAVTIGDPAGIGPEILLKAYLSRQRKNLPPFYAIADAAYLAAVAQSLSLDLKIEISSPDEVVDRFPNALPVSPLRETINATAGRPDKNNAPAIVQSIEQAVSDSVMYKARAIVTNPISKSILYAAGFSYPGHTEFLAALAQRHYGEHFRSVMMLWARELAVVPLTIHIALRAVPDYLTQELIIETAEIVARDLTSRFKIITPRLAFSGLNPHAGEDGALGREEIETMQPAIETLVIKGIKAQGPFPADTMFHAQARQAYDVALCPTHDQALIPIKTLAFDRGVNVTLGLPFVRTSPDHGTAFTIAGQNLADPTSLIEAIRLAHEMTV